MTDRQDIVDVLVRYATGIDSRDWALFRSCFTDDARFDYGDLGTWGSPDVLGVGGQHEPKTDHVPGGGRDRRRLAGQRNAQGQHQRRRFTRSTDSGNARAQQLQQPATWTPCTAALRLFDGLLQAEQIVIGADRVARTRPSCLNGTGAQRATTARPRPQ
jgi:SnoaL-like domain